MEAMYNFTPRAMQVLALSRQEAERFNHSFVGTEHLLLGLIRLGQGVAVNVLQKMGIDLELARVEVEKQVGRGTESKTNLGIPYTPRVKKVLAMADKERQGLNHSYLGTEHILLGILREGDGVAARVLKNLHVDIGQTRQEILKELDPNYQDPTPGPEHAPKAASKPQSLLADVLDTTRRYDIYCREIAKGPVVYRNALFKGARRLFATLPHDPGAEFLEIETGEGKTVFVARSCVIKFLKSGGESQQHTAAKPGANKQDG